MLPYPDIQTYLLIPQLRALPLVLHPPGNFSDFFFQLSLSCLFITLVKMLLLNTELFSEYVGLLANSEKILNSKNIHNYLNIVFIISSLPPEKKISPEAFLR